MRCVMFVVRRAWILLGSMSFIVRSFPVLSTGMTLLGMYFLIYSNERGVSVKKEAPVNFPTDPLDRRSTLRHMDVGGKHACVDLTGVSLLVGLGVGHFTMGQKVLKVVSSKVAKHEKACTDNQHIFISFAFDTFGFLAPEAVVLLHRVQKVMHNNVMSPRSMNVVFTKINFVIQKDLMTQLATRLSLFKCK